MHPSSKKSGAVSSCSNESTLKTTSPIRPFDADQLELFEKVMNRAVDIRSESRSTHIHTQVYRVIEGFLKAASSFYPASCKDSALIDHVTIIRGSTNISFLKKEQQESDVDILFKFSSPPPLSDDLEKKAGDFRFFCIKLALRALKILDPQVKHEAFEKESGSNPFPEAASSLLFSRVDGVFKKFVTDSKEQFLCIFSFGDLDITLQFGYPKGFQHPTSAAASLLPPSTPTFLHDDLETVISTSLDGRINKKAIPYFTSTLPLEEVFESLSNRVLKILNPNMFRGYIRLFHAISKGLLPDLKPLKALGEEEKIIQILSQIEPTEEVIPFSLFHSFIKEKSASADFSLHFFLNAYQTAVLIANSQEVEIKAVSDFLALLHSAFIHPEWQKLFPYYVKELLTHENPLDLLAIAFGIKAHINIVHENSVRESLGTHVRLVGCEDKVHGFYITKAISFQAVLESIRFLQSQIEKPLFDEIFKDELDSLAFLECDQDDKFLFLYGLRVLQQESLTQEEFESFLPIRDSFLALWILHQENIETSLTKYDLCAKYSYFVSQYKGLLFRLKSPDFIEPLLELLPSFIYFISKTDRKEVVEPVVVAKWAQRGTLSQIGEHLLSFRKSLGSKELFKYISALVLYSQETLLRLCCTSCKEMLQEILHRQESPSSLNDLDRKTISYLARQTAHTADFRLLIQNKKYLDELTLEDVSAYLEDSPLLFNGSSLKKTITLNLILKTRNERLLSFVFEHYRDAAYESLLNWMETFLNKSDHSYDLIIGQYCIQKALLEKGDWPARFFEENKSLALRLLSDINRSKTDQELATLLSEGLIPLWLEMIRSHLQEMSEGLVAPVLNIFTRAHLSNKLSQPLLATLVALLLKASESSSPKKGLIIKVLKIYLPALQQARVEESLANTSEYRKFVKNVVDIHLGDSLLQPLWEKEIHEVFPEHFELNEYIEWATTQPLCQGFPKYLEAKIQAASKITKEQFEKLVLYFDGQIDLLKKLIKLAETKTIATSLIAPLYKRVIPTQRTLKQNLQSLKRILEKKHHDDLILFQIQYLEKTGALAADETALLLECFKRIKEREIELKRVFFDKIWQQGFFNENPYLIFEASNSLVEKTLIGPLYREVIPLMSSFELHLQSLKYLLEKSHESDLILFQIESLKRTAPLTASERDQLVACFERIRGFEEPVKQAFFNKTLEMGVFSEVPPLLSYVHQDLNLFDISPAFYELLSLLIQQINPLAFSREELFSKIEAQIKRIRAFNEALCPTSVKSLYYLYLWVFTKEIVSSPENHLDIIFNNNIQADELLRLLPRLASLLDSLPNEFITTYLNKLIRVISEASLEITNLLELNKFIYKYISISDENESLALLETYSNINSTNIELFNLYGKVFQKALTNQNKAALRLITKILKKRFASPSFQQKKTTLKKLFEKLIANPRDLIFALEATKLLEKTFDLDSNAIFFQLMGLLAKQQSQKKEPRKAIEFVRKTFIEFEYDPSRQAEKVQSYFEQCFKDTSIETLIEILPILACDQTRSYSSSYLESVYQTQGTTLFRHILNEEPSENFRMMITLSDLFFFEKKTLTHLNILEIIRIIEEKLPLFIKHEATITDPDYQIIPLINFYADLIHYAPAELEAPMIAFLQLCLQHIGGHNFIIKPSQLYLMSIVNIIVAAKQLDQINPFIFKLKEYFRLDQDHELAQKEIVYNFVSKNIVGGFLERSPALLVDLENLIGLFQQIPREIILKEYADRSNIEPLISIFKMIVGELIELELLEAINVARSIQNLDFLLGTIHEMISPRTPIKLIAKILLITEKLSSLKPELINEVILQRMYQLCLKSLQIVLIHSDLEKELEESAIIIQGKVSALNEIPIKLVCDCFLNRLSLIINKLESKSLLLPHVAPLNTREIIKLQKQLIFYINDKLVERNPNKPLSYALPFTSIAYENIIAILTPFINPLLKEPKNELKINVFLIRFLLGISMVINKLTKKEDSKTKEETDQEKLKKLRYRLQVLKLESAIASSIQKRLIKIIELTSGNALHTEIVKTLAMITDYSTQIRA